MSVTARRDFPDRTALAEALADAVAADLARAVGRKGAASVALSGGTTPACFLRALSSVALDWQRVTVTLVDERWVDEDNARSNARFVRERLLSGAAAAATFLPLYRRITDPTQAIPQLEGDLVGIWPLDVAVLGMGTDGHTASFFPGGDRLAQALGPDNGQHLCAMTAPAAGERRVTMTLAALIESTSLYLHIEGAEKAAVLDRALLAGPIDEMPVRALLRQNRRRLDIYWAP